MNPRSPLLIFLLFGLAAATAAGAAPHVFWASDPVSPGDTALIAGGGFGQTPQVQIQRLADGAAGQAADKSFV